jgi:hypothetical protein
MSLSSTREKRGEALLKAGRAVDRVVARFEGRHVSRLAGAPTLELMP